MSGALAEDDPHDISRRTLPEFGTGRRFETISAPVRLNPDQKFSKAGQLG